MFHCSYCVYNLFLEFLLTSLVIQPFGCCGYFIICERPKTNDSLACTCVYSFPGRAQLFDDELDDSILYVLKFQYMYAYCGKMYTCCGKIYAAARACFSVRSGIPVLDPDSVCEFLAGKLRMREWVELNLWTFEVKWEMETFNRSSQAHARYSRGLYKVTNVSIYLGSLLCGY